MKINCQQQDIFKIRDGIKEHGLQEVTGEDNYKYRSIHLACGCNISFSYLPTSEQKAINESNRIACFST